MTCLSAFGVDEDDPHNDDYTHHNCPLIAAARRSERRSVRSSGEQITEARELRRSPPERKLDLLGR